MICNETLTAYFHKMWKLLLLRILPPESVRIAELVPKAEEREKEVKGGGWLLNFYVPNYGIQIISSRVKHRPPFWRFNGRLAGVGALLRPCSRLSLPISRTRNPNDCRVSHLHPFLLREYFVIALLLVDRKRIMFTLFFISPLWKFY